MWISDPHLNGDRYESNIHHLYPRSRGGTNVDDNRSKLYVRIHDDLHWLFWNLTPQEQLFKLMLLNKPIWTEEFKRDIYKILNEADENYYYKNWIYLHK